MTADPGRIAVATASVAEATVLTPDGVLDTRTYLPLRDSIIKAALDEPRAVIVDIAHLEVPAQSALAVFTSAQWHVQRWPEVPVVLVCADAACRDMLAHNGVTRYVPVHPTIGAALAALSAPTRPYRRRARTELPAEPLSLRRARDLVGLWLTAWSHQDLVPVAKVVVTVLIENVLAHTCSPADLRVETDGTAVTVAVADASHTPPGLREDPAADPGPSGLQVVAALSRMWGTAPTPTGKTVWAVVGSENRL
ncbi:sulfate transporter [Mycobacterium sp. CPCC 205372]|uniref:Sulfate transporter n=1 Tax=Mycobacterium hippophais TaxID=3016340 RepID=A0ABT4PMK7_9MYCO|nr:STAS domain-containing protein [Mycobacterium hippophais]MCZ8377792.1 sulfate transporter [Mycobacterium hippophais]